MNRLLCGRAPESIDLKEMGLGTVEGDIYVRFSSCGKRIFLQNDGSSICQPPPSLQVSSSHPRHDGELFDWIDKFKSPAVCHKK
ncbi:hypothetical protein RVB2_23460 [Pseudomonas aeruginosa]|nr:hypothetical protein RVB2_23460 [Pseudomonas aeruginosa]